MQNHVFVEFRAEDLKEPCQAATDKLQQLISENEAVCGNPSTSEFDWKSANDRIVYMVAQQGIIDQVREAIHGPDPDSKVMVSGIAYEAIGRWS